MFLRSTICRKDGKEHSYWSIVENKRLRDGRVVQRAVLYLGEINSSQELAWRCSIEVFFKTGQPGRRRWRCFPRITTRRRQQIKPSSACASRASRVADRVSRSTCWLALELSPGLQLEPLLRRAPARPAARAHVERRSCSSSSPAGSFARRRLVPSSPVLVGRARRSARRPTEGPSPRATSSMPAVNFSSPTASMFSHLVIGWHDLFDAHLELPAFRSDQHLLRVRSAAGSGQQAPLRL